MLYLQSVFVDVDIESPNSGTRPSLCNSLQLPSSQTCGLQRLCMKVMRGLAINHIQDTIVQLR